MLDLISIFAEICQAGNVGFAAGFAAFQLAMWSAATISVAGLDGSGAPGELIGALGGRVAGAISLLTGGMFGSIFSILHTVYGAIEREL